MSYYRDSHDRRGRDRPRRCEAGTTKYLLDAARVLGADVSEATAGIAGGGPAQWTVTVAFTGDGQQRWTT